MLFLISTTALPLAASLAAPHAIYAPLQDSAEEQYRFIAGLYAQEHWELCAKEARGFLDAHARHAKTNLVRYRLASALFELDRLDEAQKPFATLNRLSDFEFRDEVALRLGQCERHAGRLAQAKAALQAARDGDKEMIYPFAAYLLGEIEFENKAFDAAHAHYVDSLKLAPEADTAPACARGLAWSSLRANRFQRAHRECKTFLQRYESHEFAGEVHFVAGEALTGLKQWPAALASYGRVKDGPFLGASLRGIGFAKAQQNDHEGAAQAFQTLLTKDPQSPYAAEARLHAGAHLLQAGDATRALSVLEKGAKNVETLFWMAKAEAQLDRKEAALAHLDAALKLKPDSDQINRLQSLRGEMLYGLGRLDEATQAFGSADSDYGLHAAATAHLAAGRHAQAQATAKALLERFPQSTYRTHALQTLAEAQFAAQQYAECEKLFAELYQVESLSPEERAHALSRYAWSRYFQADLPEAARGFDRVVAEFVDSPSAAEATHMAARCYMENNQSEEARDRWSRYLARFKKGAHRDEAWLGLGRAGAGIEAWNALLDEFENSPLADEALLEIAQAYDAQADWIQAGTHYHRLTQRFPASPHLAHAQYGLGWSLYNQENPGGAVPVLRTLAASESAAPAIRTAGQELLLWCAIDDNQMEVAERAWRGLQRSELDAARRFSNAHRYALALNEAGQGGRAWKILRPFTENGADPEHQRSAWVEGVWIALQDNSLDEATSRMRAAQRVSKGDASVAEATFFVGEGHYAAEKFESAAEAYRWALEARETQVGDQAAYKLGFTLLQLDKPEKAANAFDLLTKQYPQSPLWGEGLYLLGEARMRAEDAPGAIAPLKTLREKAPKHAVLPKALFRLGQAYLETSQHKEGQATLAQLVRKHTDFPAWAEAELMRGQCLMALDRKKEARSAFDRVLTKDKGLIAARARLQIGAWYMDRDQTEDALAEYLKVALLYAHADEVAEATYRAGQCLEKTGDTEAAKKQFSDASTKYPNTEFGRRAKTHLAKMD